MQCTACSTVLPPHAAYCSNCGAPVVGTPARPGFLDGLQAKLAAVPAVAQLIERVQSVQLPFGAAAGAATGPDLVWSACLALATVFGIWQMKWYLWPVYLGAAACALLCGLKPGVAAMQRSTLFAGAAAVGLLGTDADLPVLLLFGLLARGLWGVLLDGGPGRPGFRLQGRRLQTAAAGFGLLLVSLPFQWHAVSSSAWVSWLKPGTYGNPNGPYSIPIAHTISAGGGNGMSLIVLVLPAAVLLWRFRDRAWPRWLPAVLTGLFTLMLGAGLSALRDYRGLGILLYAAGMAAVGWSLLS